MVAIRPGWDEYFLKIAEAVALRANCTRRKAGAVIVKHRRIVSTGYNGAPAGEPGCLDGHCPRGRHWLAVEVDISATIEGVLRHEPGWAPMCGCGNEWPCPKAATPGVGNYEDCTAIHAEANAIIYADRDHCEGATIYLVPGHPCYGCTKLIKGAGIVRAVFPGGEWVI